MGRNAAFGRPPAHDPLREWWYAKSRTTRINILVALVVGAIVVALVRAATSGDAERTGRRANALRPNVTARSVVTTTSTTLVGSLFAAGEPSTPTDLIGMSSTTSSTAAVARPVTVTPSARSATPSTRRAATASPATGAPTQDVIFTEVPAPATTVPASTPSVVTTVSPTTAVPMTTAPPTTAPRATSTPTTTALLRLPPLVGSG